LQVLGGDLAGHVEEADEGSKFKAGDAVAALTPGFFIFTQDGELCLSHAFETLKFNMISITI
jgi:NADPH:quinone reductase-like Zn-dependent oxidoreductase